MVGIAIRRGSEIDAGLLRGWIGSILAMLEGRGVRVAIPAPPRLHVPRMMLSSLGKLVRERRGARGLREVGREIGVSAATVMRIENGRTPDVETFGKICRWLEVDPGDFLGFGSGARKADGEPPLQISAHFRLERLPRPETVSALARMLLFVAAREGKSGKIDDADPDA